MKFKLPIIIVILLITVLMAVFWSRTTRTSQTPTETVNTANVTNKVSDGWKEQVVSQIGLHFRFPDNLMYREELGDDYGRMRTMAFYVENKDQSKPEYQLYGLFIADKESTAQDLERAQTEMDKATIKDVTIDGYKGIEGLIVGPKTRYITVLQKDGRLFSVSTIPPTAENKALTEKMLDTFDFQ